MARIALYGGAFNPPHLAHLFAITALLSRDDVDAVWLLPTAKNVFGKPMAPFEARVAMVRDALEGPFDDRVSVCLVEAERPGPSRTFDTLTALSKRHPEHAFCLVIGADNLTESHRWHRFDELTARWPLIVMGRPGHEQALAERAQLAWCRPGPTLPDVSSTAIRAALSGVGDQSALVWLPELIVEEARRLYGAIPATGPGLPKLWILGAGRVGQAFAAAWRQIGGAVCGVWNRSASAAATVVGALPDLSGADVVLLCVSDPALGEMADRLCGRLTASQHVLHCAGRLGREVLGVLEAEGIGTGSLHPLQSIRGPAAGLAFVGVSCAVEGVDGAVAAARQIAEAVGGLPVVIPEGEKASYHCAAVLAANFIVTLGDGGVSLLAALGIGDSDARRMLTPLLKGTVDHFSRAPLKEALTGPVARRDVDAIEAHVHALARNAPAFQPLYRTLVVLTAELAGWTAPELARLECILDP